MPLDELRRIEIAIELDKGVSHEELARKFTTSAAELKEIENLLRKKNVSSKHKVHRKKKSETDRGLILQKLMSGELPEKISNIKSRYTNLFSEEVIEEVFEPPYFKAITGAYLDKKIAEKKLSIIKKYFKSSFVLKREIPIISFMEYIMSNPKQIAD